MRRAEDNTGHVEVVRHAAEGETVVRVHDEEGGAPRVREQVSRVEAAVLLHLAAGLLVDRQLRLHVPLGRHQHAAQVVARVLRLRSDGKEPVGRDVEQEDSVGRQFWDKREVQSFRVD